MSATCSCSQSLNGEWVLTHRRISNLTDVHRPTHNPLRAQVPGDVHLDLFRAGIIPDPQKDDGATRVGWIGASEWWYTREFSCDPAIARRHELVFDGLCYLADVWLNGQHVGRHLSMHRPFRAEVTPWLRSRNRLTVRLLAFLPEVLKRPDLDGAVLYNNNAAIPSGYCRQRGWMRKALYSYGWDWTQGLALCGIWRDVRLESIPAARLNDVYVRAGVNGAVEISCVCQSVLPTTQSATVELRLLAGDGACAAQVRQEVLLAPGETPLRLRTTIRNPQLWWPAGMGRPYLYQASLVLRQDDDVLSRYQESFGVREIRIDEPRIDAKRGAFRFIVNGQPVYVKGANWVPPDIIPARVPIAHYAHLLDQALEAGLNYLRVWGGGIYERPEFYRLCDEKGLMLWHDFMFGNSEFPDYDPGFVAEVGAEIEAVVKRLRNHAAIVMWCGSNETDHAGEHLRKLRPNGKYYGERLFHEYIPAWLSELDQSRSYRPSSGCLGRWSPKGDSAYNWRQGVSHSAYPDPDPLGTDEKMDERTPSFINEWYGGSPPVEQSLKRFLRKRAWHYHDPVMKLHNYLDGLMRRGAARILTEHFTHDDLSDLDDIPASDWIKLFQAYHAEYVARFIEHCRRKKWVCSGNVYWMFNSAFTALDWSLVDYYGIPKPAFYAAKRANRPVLPIIGRYRDRLEIHVVNDTLNAYRGRLTMTLRRFDGRTLGRRVCPIVVAPNSAKRWMTIPMASLRGSPLETCFVQAEFRDRHRSPFFAKKPCGLPQGASSVAPNELWQDKMAFLASQGSAKMPRGSPQGASLTVRTHRFLAEFKRLKMPLADVHIRPVAGNPNAVTLASARFARRVRIQTRHLENCPDDNWFDLLPGIEKVVTFKRPVRLSDIVCRWENQSGSDAVNVTRFDLDSAPLVPGIPRSITLELFNPSDNSVRIPIRVRLPAGLTLSGSNLVAVPPLGATRSTVQIISNPFQIMPGDYIIKVGRHTVHRKITVACPFCLTPDRELVIENRTSGHYITQALKLVCRDRGHRRIACALGKLTVPPGVFRKKLKLPDAVVPFSAEWRLGRKSAGFCWIPPRYDKTLWDILPKRPFQPDRLVSWRTRYAAEPDLFHEGYGYILTAGHDPRVKNCGLNGARILLFLHHNGRRLFVDLLAWHADLAAWSDLKGAGEEDVNVEYAFATDLSQTGYEAMLTLSGERPRLFVRTRNGQSVRAYDINRNAKVFHRMAEGLMTCHFSVRWEEISGNRSVPDYLGMALVVNGGPQRYLQMFQGINGQKNPKLFGRIFFRSAARGGHDA